MQVGCAGGEGRGVGAPAVDRVHRVVGEGVGLQLLGRPLLVALVAPHHQHHHLSKEEERSRNNHCGEGRAALFGD